MMGTRRRCFRADTAGPDGLERHRLQSPGHDDRELGNAAPAHRVHLVMTTTVAFELSRIVPMTPEFAWQRLMDWRSHGEWIPLTRVEVDAVNPDCFTAWSGIGRLALEDRMHLTDQTADGCGRRARIAKLGPVIVGEAEFSVSAGITAGSAVVQWREVVSVPYLPQMLAPLAAWIGKCLFAMALGRMARTSRH